MCAQSPEDRARAYTKSGVNINSGYQLVQRIKEMVKSTRTPGVMSDIGGFGGMFKPDLKGMEEPTLVASTDGVGTKLKLAFAYNLHSTVGIDLVAMSVNDILVQGAKPLFFLDYFACGKLDVDVAETVISGIAEGCRQSGCALLGGETAEMPGMYADGEYDLAGFCVGLLDNAHMVDGSSMRVGDSIIGLGSSGAHSNGYSLIRKLLAQSGLQGDAPFPGLETKKVSEVLLTPTVIYVDAVRNILRDFSIRGMAHITGGGFYENVPRVLPAQMAARISFNAWAKSPLFHWLKEEGKLTWPEMMQIFNCGIGFILIVSPDEKDDVMRRLEALNQPAWVIGRVEKLTGKEQVIIDF